ncbi:hypothetical protein N7451_010685 [Penicillium sp. IBT 35674x]|nr:hypothetical protein N7451_010685 [Penicillium sp. IBT 35674x]
MVSSLTTIIFGPTGQVGSATALAVQKLGAHVVLALRDTNKPIPGLTSEQEKAGGYRRIQADLTKPDTIEAAVRATDAKRAFIYLAHGSSDHMRQTIEALKASGVEFVVFLSSVSVQGDIRKVPPAEYIPYAHAQVEVNLDEVFGGSGYVAVRPGFFNTNALWWRGMIQKGDVRLAYPDAKLDWISPEDIGKVAGTVLVKGAQATEDAEEPTVITLCGPKLVSQRDAVKIFGDALGKKITVTELDEKQGLEVMLENGVPEFAAGPILESMRPKESGDGGFNPFQGEAYKKAAANLQKYAWDVSSLEEWAKANKHIFS